MKVALKETAPQTAEVTRPLSARHYCLLIKVLVRSASNEGVGHWKWGTWKSYQPRRQENPSTGERGSA